MIYINSPDPKVCIYKPRTKAELVLPTIAEVLVHVHLSLTAGRFSQNSVRILPSYSDKGMSQGSEQKCFTTLLTM